LDLWAYNAENENWKRGHQNKFVVLKILDNSKNASLEIMIEVIINLLLKQKKFDDNFLINIYFINKR
jgi:hypothetical protein